MLARLVNGSGLHSKSNLFFALDRPRRHCKVLAFLAERNSTPFSKEELWISFQAYDILDLLAQNDTDLLVSLEHLFLSELCPNFLTVAPANTGRIPPSSLNFMVRIRGVSAWSVAWSPGLVSFGISKTTESPSTLWALTPPRLAYSWTAPASLKSDKNYFIKGNKTSFKSWLNCEKMQRRNRKKTKEGGRTEGRKENSCYLITILVFSVRVRHNLGWSLFVSSVHLVVH